MNNEKLFIPIILGTTRKGRQSEKVAQWILDQMKKRDDIETTLIDSREYPLPDDHGYGTGAGREMSDLRDTVVRADGFVIVVPEYNRGYPGPLKSLLDLYYTEYARKTVAFIGVGAGMVGGARVVENLLPVVRELGLVATHKEMLFPNVMDAFNDDGSVRDTDYETKRAPKFLDELVWVAGTLRKGREE